MPGPGSLFSNELCDKHDFTDSQLRTMGFGVQPEPFDGPFDLERALTMYALGLPNDPPAVGRTWRFAGWPGAPGASVDPLSRQAAHFWFNAATLIDRLYDETPRFSSRSTLRESSFDGRLTRDEASAALLKFCEAAPATTSLSAHFPATGMLLAAMFGVSTALEIVLDVVPRDTLIAYAAALPWPAPDDAAMPRLQTKARDIVRSLDLTRIDDELKVAAHVEARAPNQDLIAPVLDALLNPKVKQDASLRGLLLAINDDELRGKYVAKFTKGGVEIPIAPFLWRAVQREGYEGLSRYDDAKHGKWSISRNGFDYFEKFHSRHIVATMVDLSAHKRLGAHAERWLLNEGANAIVGLFEVATSKSTKREIGVKYLARYIEQGHLDLLLRLLANESEVVQSNIRKALALESGSSEATSDDAPVPPPTWPDWVAQVPPPKANSVPSWLAGLPPWTSKNGERVPEEVDRALRSLFDKGVFFHTSAWRAERIVVDDGLTELIGQLDGQRAREVVVAMLEAHARDGWSAHTEWVLRAFALFPSTEAIDFVRAELMGRASRKKNDAGRAHAVDALIVIDTPETAEALARLSQSSIGDVKRVVMTWVSEQAKRAKKNDAVFLLDALGRCGLDADGNATFVVGKRTYSARLIDAESFVLRDDEGHEIKAIPPQKGSGDKKLVDQQRARFIRMRELVQEQVAIGRTTVEKVPSWQPVDWKTTLLDHPIFVHVVRSYLWEIIPPLPTDPGRRATEILALARRDPSQIRVVRVAEDGTFADIDDELVPFDQLGEIELRVATKKSFTEEARLRWIDLLSSYKQVSAISTIA